MRVLWAIATIASASLAHADTELQNECFESGMAAFEAGFGVNDIGASRFNAPDATRQLIKVHLLFGGDTATKTITLKVYDDTAGTDAPGAELASADFQLTGSNSALQELDVTAMNIMVPAQFRVGILFPYMGAPALARDNDGITANRNFIYDPSIGWRQSSLFGVTGDWILRATVSGSGQNVCMPVSTCTSNTDCATGMFCDVDAHMCTMECTTNADCGDGTCNSIGMCVGGTPPEEPGGCCQTGGSPSLALLLMLPLFRRRRR